MFAIVLLSNGLLLGFGCPREVQTPQRGDSTPCDRVEQCNGGRACGVPALFSCVDGLCETEASLVVPCPLEPDGG